MMENKVQKLIDNFASLTAKQRKDYNEANTANVFIRPLLESLGWDFSDIAEIEAEKAIVKGRVDYVFKTHNVSKFCVEIKALRHELNDEDREQAISYAYNKGVTWAILTNFVQLQVFNAERKSSNMNDLLSLNLSYTDYASDYESLSLISKESTLKDQLNQKAVKVGKLAKRIPIEKRLYQALAKWRGELSNQLYGHYKDKGLTLLQTDQLIQKLFSRLIFIRTAEDRDLAGDHPLLAALHQWENKKGNLHNDLRNIFKDFAVVFDSELFPKENDAWDNYEIYEDTLAEVIQGLYSVSGDFAKYNFNIIEPDVLGQVYEQYLGYVAQKVTLKQKGQLSLLPQEEIEFLAQKGKRKKGGIYYTPKWVTDYIVKQTLNRYFEGHTYDEVLNIKIVDPACGSGSFLIRAYDELLSYHARKQGIAVSELNWSERVKILKANIYGADLDKQAVEIARLNLLIRALSDRKLLPKLENNIQEGNSLIFGTDTELKQALGENFKAYNPFNWKERFPEAKTFDIIIGNPPYEMELRKNKDIFQPLRVSPLGQKYYEPKMDIFYFFIELGLDLLNPNGYLGFIVQQYWISRTFASKLRKKIFIQESHPLTLVDFDGYKVFVDAKGQHNMITILQKSRSQEDKTLIYTLKKTEVTENQIIEALASKHEMNTIFDVNVRKTSELYDSKTDKVYLVNEWDYDILSKLKENSFSLEKAEIQQGLVTPQDFLNASSFSDLEEKDNHKVGDGIFVLNKSELNDLGLNKTELELIRPFHPAENIDSYYFNPEVEHYLIYTSSKIAKIMKVNLEKYPSLSKHLDQYQKIITSSNKPYGLHRARQAEWFDDIQKIMCVRKTMYPKCALIPDRYYVDQSVCIIRLVRHKTISPYYILGILNSMISHFYLYHQKKQGNQLQVDKDVLDKFPFPIIDINSTTDKQSYENVISFVHKLIDLKNEYAIADAHFKVKGGSEDLFGEKPKAVQKEIEKYSRNLIM